MKTPTIIFILILLLSSPGWAETLVSSGGVQNVLIFETKDKFDYFVKECSGKGDSRVYQSDCIQCVKKMVPVGLKVSVIERSRFGLNKIRIMSKEFHGVTGWVPSEMIQ